MYYKDLCFSSFKNYVGEAFEVLPGEVLKFDYCGKLLERRKFDFEDVFKEEEVHFEDALEKVEDFLLEMKFENSCIAFSGGIDSSFLAALYDLPLISVTAKKEDEEKIREAAKMIGRDLEIWRVSKEDVLSVFDKVLKTVETTDLLQISIAVPVFLTMLKAKILGFNSIIFGSGADELFGGYKRYEMMSKEELEKALLEDLKNVGEKNLVRDSKISYENEIKLITPYLNWDLIKLALSIPVEMKVKKVDGKIVRKFALRKLAERYLPKELVWREKKAIQYSTGIAKMVRECFSQIGRDAGS